MPIFPGGPCPECGDQMPAKLVHCANCRALLNPELQPKPIVHPDFVELAEVEVVKVIKLPVHGYFVDCSKCQVELKIHAKYIGQAVVCRYCSSPVDLGLKSGLIRLAVYSVCPHCQKEVRAALKYLDKNVACKFCGGGIHFVDHNLPPVNLPSASQTSAENSP